MLTLFNSLFNKQNIIEFYTEEKLYDLIEHPRQSIKFMPQWFKDLSPTFTKNEPGVEDADRFGLPWKTAKSCPPLLDAFALGVTIPFPFDIHIKTNDDLSSLSVNEPFKEIFHFIESHHPDQIGGEGNLYKMLPRNMQHGKVLKFVNPWVIKTAPGWSTLFIQPLNNFNLPFTCLSGVVETDKYFTNVNFPFLWTLKNADEHIHAGTPMITCIPFKRTNNSKPIINVLNNEQKKKRHILDVKLTKSYTSFYKRKIRGSDDNV